MAQDASMEGGPEAYLARIQSVSHSIGFAEGLEEGRWQGGAFGLVIGIGASLLGFRGVHLLRKRRIEREEAELAREVELKEAVAGARFALEFDAEGGKENHSAQASAM